LCTVSHTFVPGTWRRDTTVGSLALQPFWDATTS
jgi:hypothetical protein